MLVIIAMIFISIFISFKVYPEAFSFKSKDIVFDKQYYDIRSINIYEKAIGELAVDPTSKVDIQINFLFKMPENGLKSEYENIFQTADLNNGLRMEVSKKSGVIALIYNSGDRDNKVLTSIVLIDHAEIDTAVYHNVAIQIKNGTVININIDGQAVRRAIDPNCIELSRILVGQGFDNSRKFSGIIKNFKLKARCYYKIPSKTIGNIAGVSALIILSIISFYGISNKNKLISIIHAVISVLVVYWVAIFYKHYMSDAGITFDQLLTNLVIITVGVLLSALVGLIDRKRTSLGIAWLMILAAICHLYFRGDLVTTITIVFLMIVYILFDIYVGDLKKFAFIYGVLAVFLNVPNLIPWISISVYYEIIFTAIVLSFVSYLLIFTKKDLISKRNSIEYAYYERVTLYLFVCVMLFGAFVYSFVWDDLNGTLWVPKVSVIKDHSIVGVNLPATLTFMSIHNLGYLTSLYWLFSHNELIDKIFAWKNFNAWLYISSVLLFYKYNRPFIRRGGIALMCLLLYAFIPGYMYGEVTGNNSDYALVISTFIVVGDILTRKKIRHNDLLVFSALLAVSPKSFIVIGPYFLIKIIEDPELRANILTYNYIWRAGVGLLLIAPVYLRNYIISGNPTFPAGNINIKSPLFDITGIVADKYRVPGGVSLYNYFDLLVNKYDGIKNFYASDLRYYGPVFLTLICILFYCFVVKMMAINIRRNYLVIDRGVYILFLVSVLGFLFASAFTGLQHRYLYSVIVAESVLVVLLIYRNSGPKKDYVGVIVIILVSALYTPMIIISPSVFGEYVVKNGYFAGSEDKWTKRCEFYRDVNLKISDGEGVLMSYVQDKVFIDSTNNLYELDWYDYPKTNALVKSFDLIDRSNIDKARIAGCKILKKNGIKWLLLTKARDPFGMDIRCVLIKVVDGHDLDLNLYKIP